MNDRASPFYSLYSCPECDVDFHTFMAHMSPMDEWSCPSCFAMLDVWWKLSDLSWTHDHDKLPEFKADVLLHGSYKDLTRESKVCCDKRDCRCPNSVYMPFDYVKGLMETHGLRVVDDVYDCNDYTQIDCRACTNYGEYGCIPLRNWVRYTKAYGVGTAPKLQLCYDFEEDTEYVHFQDIDIAKIHRKISDDMYYNDEALQ